MTEEENQSAEGNKYYVMKANRELNFPEVARLRPQIGLISRAGAVPLELAATYDAFRENGFAHDEAIRLLRDKKGEKCTPENLASALQLLKELCLPAD